MHQSKVSWSQLKAFLDARGISCQYVEFDHVYIITGIDGPFSFITKIKKTSPVGSDQTDFETNYKPSGNSVLVPSDTDGVHLSRTKITKSGWHYQIHGTEFTSAKLNSVYNKDEDGNDLGFTTIKYYNVNDVELVAGTQAELDTDCVKTVFTWEPDQDIDVIGGVLEQPTPTTNDVRLWVTAIPDLPVPNGSVPFTTGGINLKYISGNIDIDGKTAKTLPYNATYHTNKFRITVRHDAGDKYPVHMLFKIYRENS